MVKNTSRSSSASSQEGGAYKRLKLEDTDSETTTPESESVTTSGNTSSSSTSSSISSISSNSSNMKTQAAFVNKLYKMLEDPQTSKLISWSTQGDLFSVSNPTLFSKSVLPQYFKHNNWQSFVRQLNMYGFHKVNDLIHSNLTNENQTWEFKHPHFRRGAVSDLQHIKRKSAKTHIQLQKQQDSPDDTPHHQHHPHHPHPHQQQQQHQPHPAHLLADMDSPKESLTDVGMEDHVHRIESHLLSVSKSCELLYSEVVNLRSVVSKQQAAMQDLVDVVSACQFNPSQKDEKTNGTPHFSTPPLTHHLLHETEKTSAFRRPADTLGAYVSPPFRKLTLIDSLASDTFYHKSLPITERNHSMMSFGKESHMLNPSDTSGDSLNHLSDSLCMAIPLFFFFSFLFFRFFFFFFFFFLMKKSVWTAAFQKRSYGIPPKVGFTLKRNTQGEAMQASREIVQTPGSTYGGAHTLEWQEKPRNVLMITKCRDTSSEKALVTLARWLHQTRPEMNLVVEKSVAEACRKSLPQVHTLDPEDYSETIDFAITLGGDGTLLRLSSLFPKAAPPVLSFSLGTLCFLKSYSFDRYQEILGDMMAGNIGLTMRMRLFCSLHQHDGQRIRQGGKRVQGRQVMNEVSLHRGRYPHLTSIDCRVNGHYLTECIADGLIVSTPTGSTAYSLSAGGPIVHPTVQSLVLTPICPRSLSFRTVLLPSSSVIELKIGQHSRNPTEVNIDGQEIFLLHRGDYVKVRMSKYPIPCVTHLTQHTHWEQDINELLKWNQSFGRS